jgi:hypothetical protein
MLPGHKDDENKEDSRSVNRKIFVKVHWRRKISNRFARWCFAEALGRAAAFPSSLLDFAQFYGRFRNSKMGEWTTASRHKPAPSESRPVQAPRERLPRFRGVAT